LQEWPCLAGTTAHLVRLPSPLKDIPHVTAYLRQHGTRAVALVGASEGARLDDRGGDGPSAGGRGRRSRPYAARLTSPATFVTAADDPYDAAPAARGFYRSAQSAVKRLLVVPGDAHGTALLSRQATDRQVTAFILRYDRPS
jgi:pimeloyl-ACP methyl ester carboxylesterase